MRLAPLGKLDCGCDAGYCPQITCRLLQDNDEESKPGADDAGSGSESTSAAEDAVLPEDEGRGGRRLACGCAAFDEDGKRVPCCGICVHAKAVGRTRENAAEFKYPCLNGLRGKAKLAERNGDDGEPTMWFWQVEGRRWDLDGGSFHTAKKAWERLAATDEQLAAENEKRYDRKATPAWMKENDKKEKREKRQREEEQEAERARRWRELRRVLRRSGLERLAPDAEEMRDHGILESLYEPQHKCSPERAPFRGLLGCAAAFLTRSAGHELDAFDMRSAACIDELRISAAEARARLQPHAHTHAHAQEQAHAHMHTQHTRAWIQAAALHRAVALALFEGFVEGTLAELEATACNADGSLASLEQLFDLLYVASKQGADGRWEGHLDIAERLGSAWAADELAGGRPLSLVLRDSVLRDAADGVLQLALAHARVRSVLIETLTRYAGEPVFFSSQFSVSEFTGHKQMYALLKHPCAGVKSGHYSSLLWYLGQLEAQHHGRLWASRDGEYPTSPATLCALAHGSTERTAELAKLFSYSAVLREPVRLLIDAEWERYVAAAWQHPPGWRCLGDVKGSYIAGLESHLRGICRVLMPIAIAKHDTCFASGRLSLVLLRALHTVAARGIESETAVSLRAACQVLHEAVLQHRRARSECEKCMRLQSEFSVLINEEYRRHVPTQPLLGMQGGERDAFLSSLDEAPPGLVSLRTLCLRIVARSLREEGRGAESPIQMIDPRSIPRSFQKSKLCECPHPPPVCRGALDRCRDPLHRSVRRHLVWNSSVMQFQLEQCSQPCGQSAAEQIATVMRAVRRLDDPDAPRPRKEELSQPAPAGTGPTESHPPGRKLCVAPGASAGIPLYCCHTPASVGPCPQAALACLFEAAECLLAAERPPTPPPPPLRVSLGLARDEWDGHEPFNEDVHAYTAREDAYEYIDSDEREERRGDRILARRWAAYAYP